MLWIKLERNSELFVSLPHGFMLIDVEQYRSDDDKTIYTEWKERMVKKLRACILTHVGFDSARCTRNVPNFTRPVPCVMIHIKRGRRVRRVVSHSVLPLFSTTLTID